MKPEFWLALYGSVTATLTGINQIRTWHHDRVRLKVDAEISIKHDYAQRLKVFLSVRVVNVGRRPVKIKQIGINLLPDGGSLPKMFVKTLPEQENIPQPKMIECELLLFGARGEPSIELGDGDECSKETTINQSMRFMKDRKKGEKFGTGYVMFTSGEKVPFTFLLLDAEAWPK